MIKRQSTLNKARFLDVPMEQGRQWRGGGPFLFQQKMDGVWFPVQAGEFSFITEKMRDGTLWAHTLTHCGGQDLAGVPLRETMPELRRILKNPISLRWGEATGEPGTKNSSAREYARPTIKLMPEFSGGEGLEAIWRDGGEGGIAKRLDLPWTQGGFKCKRSQVFYVVVIEKHEFKSSVRAGVLNPEQINFGDSVGRAYPRAVSPIGSSVASPHQTGLPDAGWLPVHGTKFDRCRVGSVLKVEAFGLTAAGKLREARLDKDTPDSWLVKF